jgi:hypothetical protein
MRGMSVVVINRISLSVPAARIREAIEREFPPAFEECAGFQRFCVVQTADDEIVVLIFWDSAADAAAGAAHIGPTVFGSVVMPHLAGQDRTVGPVIVDHPGSG